MKRFRTILFVVLTLFLGVGTGCKNTNARLEPGGAYTVPAPDYAFYAIDASYDLAYSSIDAAFKFEYDNRAYLFGISPQIKHTLDSIRPQAADANKQYLLARAAYISNPTPAGLTGLQAILTKVQQFASAIAAILPKAK